MYKRKRTKSSNCSKRTEYFRKEKELKADKNSSDYVIVELCRQSEDLKLPYFTWNTNGKIKRIKSSTALNKTTYGGTLNRNNTLMCWMKNENICAICSETVFAIICPNQTKQIYIVCQFHEIEPLKQRAYDIDTVCARLAYGITGKPHWLITIAMPISEL